MVVNISDPEFVTAKQDKALMNLFLIDNNTIHENSMYGTNIQYIDECAIGISKCTVNSVCINTPGWYQCDCLEGYHSTWPDNNFGSLCLDVNECQGEGSGHTCHMSTTCVNTEGGYTCACQIGMPCINDCMRNGEYHRNNSVWTDEEDKCIQCLCQVNVFTMYVFVDTRNNSVLTDEEDECIQCLYQNGVTSCHKKPCDCSAADVDFECCRHCDESSKCQHQEVPIFLKNGERWIFQCQTCECLVALDLQCQTFNLKEWPTLDLPMSDL
ncbi:unnamed protein product [Mytilus edulis]|uniref:EGF-like domain-containing protein n=1 Tax=Mytilus edulis TaxID=6550 RepID=A0A8S3VJ18_MYTED|nr:unnamed protein product [Mytilus edulis]